MLASFGKLEKGNRLNQPYRIKHVEQKWVEIFEFKIAEVPICPVTSMLQGLSNNLNVKLISTTVWSLILTLKDSMSKVKKVFPYFYELHFNC